MIPDRRFRPEPMRASEAIDWLKTHDYIWYQAPMDHKPLRLQITSKLKLWKREPERFQVSVVAYGYDVDRFKIDNGHLDRLRLPFDQWHHGVSAVVHHVNYVGMPHRIVLSQSNGFHLHFADLSGAINFARSKAMELKVRHGKRERILVAATPPISGERNF